MFDTTIEALDKTDRELFLAFGHFFAPVTTVDLLQRHYADAPHVERSMNGLQDWGLVRYVRGSTKSASHYRLHDLAFSYCRAKATTPTMVAHSTPCSRSATLI